MYVYICNMILSQLPSKMSMPPLISVGTWSCCGVRRHLFFGLIQLGIVLMVDLMVDYGDLMVI